MGRDRTWPGDAGGLGTAMPCRHCHIVCVYFLVKRQAGPQDI